jgi:hypothetical protein
MAKQNSKEQNRKEKNRVETKASKGNPKLEGPDRPST